MDSPNTPVHQRLWHREFSMLAVANLLLTMSVYMFIPVIPLEMAARGCSPVQTAVVVASGGVGIYLLGCFVSFLVQRFRRARVCMVAILCMIAIILSLYYARCVSAQAVSTQGMLLFRLALAAVFGLGQMVLTSTLIIDVCESAQRTHANRVAMWFSRAALVIAPLLAIFLYRQFGVGSVLLTSSVCAFLAYILVKIVSFPFKAPDDCLPLFSLDRFLLPRSSVLSLNLMVVASSVGVMLASQPSMLFYAMLAPGIALAILADRFVFTDDDIYIPILSGHVLIVFALILMHLFEHLFFCEVFAAVFMAFGIGILSSRFLLSYIAVSQHCQRGTSQTTYFLSWESGLFLGLGMGVVVTDSAFTIALALMVFSAVLYHFVTHPWNLNHKSR